MTSESGLTYEDTDYTRHIQEALHELHQLQQTPRLVTSPDELEALEREIRQHTDRLGSLLVGHHLQQALDSAAMQAEQEHLVRQWPPSLKNDGKVRVMIRTAQGLAVPVRVTYYRRKGQRRAGKRAAAVMSLIHSARLNGHDAYLYLKDVLERLPTQPASCAGDLLPHRWQPAA